MDMSTTPTLIRHQLYIDGRFVEPAAGQFFESDNPYTGEPWALIPRGNAEDVDRAVRAAHKALTSGPWPKLTATQRGALLRIMGAIVLVGGLARLVSLVAVGLPGSGHRFGLAMELGIVPLVLLWQARVARRCRR